MKIFAQLAFFGSIILAVGVALSSCTTEPYCFACDEVPFGGGEDGSSESMGTTTMGADSITIGVGPQGTGGTEASSGAGGNGGAGGACDADTENDPRNCGACGVECVINGAIPLCVNGKCTFEECSPTRFDRNDNPADGCEAFCAESNGGVEICDGIDNDCDFEVDEDFDLTSEDNCGSCGNVCDFPHSTSECAEVDGEYVCRIDECDEGWFNFDGTRANGCEKNCVESNDGVEICDGLDNDCDGQIDEEAPNVGQTCWSASLCPWGPNGGECVGPCADRGVYICSGNQLVCVPKAGAPTPSIELCDGLDNDCDGEADEDFDLTSNPNHCGACNSPCSLPNAFAKCENSQCVIDTCKTGYNDLDPDEPGCEYECPEAVNDEVCDGVDNDCDGLVDDEDPSMIVPQDWCTKFLPNDGAGTLCEGATIQCNGASGWACNYPNGVEVDPKLGQARPEVACDNVDNNCDGKIDEGMGRYYLCNDASQCGSGETCNAGRCTCDDDIDCPIGHACSGGFCTPQCFAGVGECQNSSITTCSGGDAVCTVVALDNAQAEECNGLDDDCDGSIDEATDDTFPGVEDAWVEVDAGGGNFFYIYQYEAARPDSVSNDGGILDARACSKPDAIPWTSVNRAQASAACQAAGARLCTEAEWERACDVGGSGTRWAQTGPTVYNAGICNDVEYYSDPNDAQVWPGGTEADCRANHPDGPVYDMSGNVSEWTSTQVSNNGNQYFRVRGGNFNSFGPATACDFDFVLMVPTFANADLGFRCCADAIP